jgi:hypothetical protein
VIDFPEPTDEELDIAETMLRLLDRAFTAASPPFAPDDWETYMANVAAEVPDLETARHIVGMLLLQDAADLIMRHLSPAASWQQFYETWGHRR